MTEINIFDLENAKAQMKKGLLEFCILLVISRGKTYAGDILVSLKEADLIVVEGTVYPLLNRLKKSGLLTYEWEESRGGPPRKYYSLTDSGRSVLSVLEKTWEAFGCSVKKLINEK